MNSCTNCREVTDQLSPVLVGSFTEHWCQFCVEMSATPCKTCGQRADKDTAYRSGIGESVAYYCVSHRFAPLVKSRPRLELGVALDSNGDTKIVEVSIMRQSADELLGWLDNFKAEALPAEPFDVPRQVFTHRVPPISAEPCCDPDYDYEKGKYVHAEGCHGSVEANEGSEGSMTDETYYKWLLPNRVTPIQNK